MGRRYYSAQKIARTKLELVAHAGRVKPTSEAENVAQETVRHWRDGKYPPHVDPAEVEREVEAMGKEMAEGWERIWRLSQQKTEELVPAVKHAKDAAIITAIATDKRQLLRGRPTERVAVQDLASFLGQDAEEHAS